MKGAFCYNGTMNNLIKSKLELLPTSPGCYIHKDKNGTIIYVGKAKNLKNRVSDGLDMKRLTVSLATAAISIRHKKEATFLSRKKIFLI